MKERSKKRNKCYEKDVEVSERFCYINYHLLIQDFEFILAASFLN